MHIAAQNILEKNRCVPLKPKGEVGQDVDIKPEIRAKFTPAALELLEAKPERPAYLFVDMEESLGGDEERPPEGKGPDTNAILNIIDIDRADVAMIIHNPPGVHLIAPLEEVLKVVALSCVQRIYLTHDGECTKGLKRGGDGEYPHELVKGRHQFGGHIRDVTFIKVMKPTDTCHS